MDNKLTKSQLCAIGEHLVAAKLIEMGWDVFMANQSINNVEAYDLICVEPLTKKTIFVQVKCSVDSSFPIGMNIGNASDLNYLQKRIVGPWVFVRLIIDDGGYKPEFYVLTKDEMIEITHASNDWYVHQYFRTTPVKSTNACALTTQFLSGVDINQTNTHAMFHNPFKKKNMKDDWKKLMP